MKYSCLLLKSTEFSGPHRASFIWKGIWILYGKSEYTGCRFTDPLPTAGKTCPPILILFCSPLWLHKNYFWLPHCAVITGWLPYVEQSWFTTSSYVKVAISDSYDFCLDFWNVPIKLLRSDFWKYVCNIFLKLWSVLSNATSVKWFLIDCLTSCIFQFLCSPVLLLLTCFFLFLNFFLFFFRAKLSSHCV